ncbi:MAG: pyrroline-5-carboxylate reductase [Chloroflexi bacterium]|nr:pyrroline-5-carboxylate reductase [Chloroflexota bacterium]
MGTAILSALLDAKIATPTSIVVSDVSQSRRDAVNTQYGVATTESNADAVADCEVAVLAVKPQNLKEVLTGLQGTFRPNQLVVSIVAGARIQDIAVGLQHRNLVRAMPNMPAQVRNGVTVWTATVETGEEQRCLAKEIFGTLGKEFFVSDEKFVDMATAVSGSGPAYIFLIVEAFVDAAVHIGFPRDLAQQIVLETMSGSVQAIRATGKHPAELKAMVTSPGGTTAEALLELEAGGLRSTLVSAVVAAYEKTKRLG